MKNCNKISSKTMHIKKYCFLALIIGNCLFSQAFGQDMPRSVSAVAKNNEIFLRFADDEMVINPGAIKELRATSGMMNKVFSSYGKRANPDFVYEVPNDSVEKQDFENLFFLLTRTYYLLDANTPERYSNGIKELRGYIREKSPEERVKMLKTAKAISANKIILDLLEDEIAKKTKPMRNSDERAVSSELIEILKRTSGMMNNEIAKKTELLQPSPYQNVIDTNSPEHERPIFTDTDSLGEDYIDMDSPASESPIFTDTDSLYYED